MFPKACCLILIVFLASFSALAEYRVYQYFIKPGYNLPQKTESSVETSTLDPQSYLAYYGGQGSVKIDLLRTWMCMGDTSERDLCPGPEETAP